MPRRAAAGDTPRRPTRRSPRSRPAGDRSGTDKAREPGKHSGSKPIGIASFIEPVQRSIGDLRNLAIPDTEQFRQRVRANSAEPVGMLLPADQVIPERKVGRTNDLLPFYVLERGVTAGEAVCKVAFPDGEDGTGFLVAPDILVTNNHVVPTVERAREARCHFDFQLDPDGLPREITTVGLLPDSLFITSPELDYTFVRIQKVHCPRVNPIKASRGSFTNVEGEFATIIQHPDGRMKEVAYRDNRIVSHNSPLTIRYTTDTEGGSSGSPVFNSDWRLIGLHHAAASISKALRESDPTLEDYEFLNEAVKLSAIANDLEQRMVDPDRPEDAVSAREALRSFSQTDSLLGYFGTLGRDTGTGTVLEKVVNSYRGEASDIDVGFWNVEWFARRYRDKVREVARIIVELQLDVYALIESSPAATRHLVELLKAEYGMRFDHGASEPDAAAGRQTTTVMWNTETIERLDAEWPGEVQQWFEVDSRAFDDLQLEAVHGKVFNRYPGLFRFRARNREDVAEPFDFYLVPLHLKAMSEGALRRRMASQILAAAIKRTNEDGEADWVVGGDINAELATGDFAKLMESMTAIGAADEEEGAMTYLKSPRSMIDHIFLSPNLSRHHGASDFFIVASDTKTLDYIKTVSDHRPVLVRLSLRDPERKIESATALPDGLADALAPLAGHRSG